MTTALSQISNGFAQGFDSRREDLLGKRAKIILLKEDGRDGYPPFRQVRIISKGWYPVFSDFAGMTVFRVADISAEFGQDVRRSNHLIVIDSDNPSLNFLLHEFKTQTAFPDPNQPFWRIGATSLGRLYKFPEEK